MYFDDHKKQIMTIMSRRNGKGEMTMSPTPMKAESVKSEDGQVDGRHLAAQELIAAFHEKSAEKLMNALANFIDLHHFQKESEEEAESAS